MLVQERRSLIIQKIQQQRMVKVADLMEEFDVSIETVRRDLEHLEQRGHLKRVYGGAVLHGLYGEEPSYEHREVSHYEEKRAIGRLAASLVNDGDTLFMEVGTTLLEVAACLRDKQNLTVITNATLIAHEMIKAPGCRVILLGGDLRPGELSVSGALADAGLRHFYANKMLMGVGGITLEAGITDYNVPEANTRREMLERSGHVIAVADYSKFGVTAMNAVCPVNRVDSLVVDWSVPGKTVADYRAAGLQVHVAPAP